MENNIIEPGISQNERYTIFGPYEDGGCSSVDWGWDSHQQKWVVLKKLKSENIKKIQEEIKVSRSFKDIHQCVPCTDWFVIEKPRKQYILVFDYIEHMKLRDLLPKLSFKDICRFSGQFLWLLNKFHERGIIHRDIKPGNVLLDKQTLDLRIIDFGMCISGYLQDKKWHWNNVSPKSGTAQFMSPEQERSIIRNEPLKPTPKIDIWSVGCIILEWWSGKGPFFPSNVSEKWKIWSQLWNTPNGVHDISLKKRPKSIRFNKEYLLSIKKPEYNIPENSLFFDFLENILELYPSKRLSAKKLLIHPFLQEVEYNTCFLYDLVQVMTEPKCVLSH